MKTILMDSKHIKNICLLFCMLFALKTVHPQNANEDTSKTIFKHAIGAGAGFITGYGLSYRYMPSKFGVQLNFAPYHDNETDRYSLGITFLYTIIKNNISSLFFYEGNHYYYNSVTVYNYDPFIPNNPNPTKRRETTNYFNNGVGFGIELIIVKRISLNLMTGYAFYNNFTQVNITGETALYYKF